MPNENESTRRILAAIVFSDIVSFSAHMQENEDRTLRLVQRDLTLLQNVCEQCSGRVLKNTGDGLLMYFESAVQAVACAMQGQKAIAKAAEGLPEEEVLLHRIGIHLGDVFLSPDDVMGDGVNVASRIQAEAPPGGICLSQTVYDVVKNRLAVQCTYLGPKELKNIQEAVPVYEILLDAAAKTSGKKRRRKKHSRAKFTNTVLLGGAVAISLVVAVIFLVIDMLKPDDPVTVKIETPVAGVPSSNGAETNGAAPIPVDNEARQARMEAQQAKGRFLRTRDFKGMVQWLKDHGQGESLECKNYQRLEKLQGILKIRIAAADSDDPIRVALPDGQEGEMWGADQPGRIHLRVNGQVLTRSAAGLRQGVFVAALRAIATPAQDELIGFLESEYQSLPRLRRP